MTKGIANDKIELSDEEIVKALENCANDEMCRECPYFIKGIDCGNQRSENDYLDLIRRLQDENKRLNSWFNTACARCDEIQVQVNEYERKLADGELVSKDWHDEQVLHAEEQCQLLLYNIEELQGENAGLKERGEIVINSLHETIDKQKAEIERLTEEHERIAWSKQEYLDWVHGFLSTHTEMKDRGEKYEMFDRDWMCNTFWAKIEGSLDYIIDLENQRNELQKQVDELNAKLQCPTDITEAVKPFVSQAEKDTAKEILGELDLFFKGTTFRKGYEFKKIDKKLKEIAKKNGVEVE